MFLIFLLQTMESLSYISVGIFIQAKYACSCLSDGGSQLVQSQAHLDVPHNFLRSIFPSLLPQDHIIRFAWLGDISTSNG